MKSPHICSQRLTQPTCVNSLEHSVVVRCAEADGVFFVYVRSQGNTGVSNVLISFCVMNRCVLKTTGRRQFLNKDMDSTHIHDAGGGRCLKVIFARTSKFMLYAA